MTLPIDLFVKPSASRLLGFGEPSPSRAEHVATSTVVEWMRVLVLGEVKGYSQDLIPGSQLRLSASFLQPCGRG